MNSIYDHVYHLSEVIGERSCAARYEKETVKWISNKLKDFRLSAHIETFKTPSSAYSFFQFAFLIAFFISFFYLKFYYIFKIAFLIDELLLIVLFYKEFNFKHTFISELFKTRESRNVITEINAQKESKKTIYITAHIDSPSAAGIMFHPLIVKYLKLLPKIIFGALFLLFIISMVSFFWDDRIIELIFLSLSIIFFICFGISVYSEYFVKPTSGANNNASGAGELLGLMEYFSSNPLKNTKLIGIFTGAKEAGCAGIYEYLKKHEKDIDENSYFIVLDCIGIGAPVYIKSEGMLKKYKPDPELVRIINEVKQKLDNNIKPFDLSAGYTEMQVINNFKFKTIAIGAAYAGEKTFPYSHQMQDRIIFIQPDTLKKVFAFVKNILRTIDKKI